MRAAVLRVAPGELEIVDGVDVDDPAEHEVLVRTAAAGLCHSDLHYIDGVQPWHLPAVLGHESSGVVEAVGRLVTRVRPGDHIVTCLSLYCGSCEFCLTGRLVLCTGRDAVKRGPNAPPRLVWGGQPLRQFYELSSFAELMLVHEHAVIGIDREIPLDAAALVGCAVTTGLGAVFNTAQVGPGSSVAVVGCGGVGLSAVQAARIAGAGQVIAIDTVEAHRELARRFGATDAIDGGRPDAVDLVLERTRGGVEHAIEAVGAKATVETAFAMLRRGGTCTVVGMLPSGQRVGIPGGSLLEERRLQGSRMGSNRSSFDVLRYLDMYTSGALKLDELITRRIPLAEINDGFAAMRTGAAGRTVVIF